MADVDPLTGPPPPEVPLPRAPLVRVIAQVRFPTILAVRRPDRMVGLQEAICADYPDLRPEQTHNIKIEPGREPQFEPSMVWRFVDISGRWQATVAQDFVALETETYTSRDDFFSRFNKLVGAIGGVLEPQIATRIGVRYIDRLSGSAVENIGAMVRSEILGMAGLFRERALRVIGASLLEAAEGRVQARWGLLPPGDSFDPATVAPIDTPSWVLDLDMFKEERRAFVGSTLVAEAESFAKRIYTVFRWFVTDEFLRHYGGQP